MQRADSELFSDYQESTPAFGSDDHESPASPGLLLIQQLQQTTTKINEARAPNKKPPHFELPAANQDDPDNAFPFQLGTNVSLARASLRQEKPLERAREQSTVSVSTGHLTPDQETRDDNRSPVPASASPKEVFVQRDVQGQLSMQPSPCEDQRSSPDERENADGYHSEERSAQPITGAHDEDRTPETSTVSPDRTIVQPGEHEEASSQQEHTYPQHFTNGHDLPISATTTFSKQDEFLGPVTEASGIGGGSGPSEEDLLMLLNRRNRSRMQENARLVSYSRSVQTQNLALIKDRKAAIEQINRMGSDLETARQHNIVLETQMETFQTKYMKLKTWAIEMNQEYAVLDAARGHINASLAEAKQDHDKVVHDSKEARAVHDRAAGDLMQLKRELQATRVEMSRNEKDVAVLKVKLSHAITSLQQERSRNQQYVEHICQLTNAHDKTEELIGRMSQTLTSTCEKACENLQQSDNSGTKLDECLSTLRDVRQVLQAHVSVTSERDQYSTVPDNQLDPVQSVLDHIKSLLSEFNSQHSDNFQQVLQAVQSLAPDLECEKSLTKKNVALEEKQRAMYKVETVLRGDKTAALLHLTGLIEAHNQLLARPAQVLEIAQTQENEKLRTRLDQFELLHAQRTHELTRVQQQLELQSQYGAKADADARAATANMQKALFDAQRGFQEKLDQEMKSKDVALSALSDRHQAALSTRDEALQTTRLELDRECGRSEALTAQIKRLEHELADKDQLVRQQQIEISAAKLEHAKMVADKSHVDQQLALTKDQAEQLQHSEDELKQLRNINADGDRHKQRAEMLEDKLVLLEGQLANKLTELHGAEIYATVLCEKVKRLQDGKDTMHTVSADLREILAGLNGLRREADKSCNTFKRFDGQEEEVAGPAHDLQQLQAATTPALQNQDAIESVYPDPDMHQAQHVETANQGTFPQQPIKTAAVSKESQESLFAQLHDDPEVGARGSNSVDRLPVSVFDDDQDLTIDFTQDANVPVPQPKDRSYEISSSEPCILDIIRQQVADAFKPAATFDRVNSSVTEGCGSFETAQTAPVAEAQRNVKTVPGKTSEFFKHCGTSDSPLSEHDSWFDEIDPDNHNGNGIDEADFDEADFDVDEINAVATVNAPQATALTRMERSSNLSDDMLLRSSLPPRSQGSPPPVTMAGRSQLQIRVESPQKSPVKLRSGHQVQLVSRGANRETGRRESTPRPTEREPTRPNSAAKRCSTESAEFEPKRSKHSFDKVGIRKPGQAESGTKAVGDWMELSRQLPVGSRSSGSVFKPQAAPVSKSKPSKFKTTRKSAKDNKYSQRFSSQA